MELPSRVNRSTGRPPRWTPLQDPIRLRPDGGKYFRDKNAARFPKHPLEPAIFASLQASPDLFKQGQVDIVACGSSLGNLLRFVRRLDKPFRTLVEIVGDTVFFTRRENSPTELIPDVRGFGHTFPEAYTTWDADVKGSDCHERLIRYSFGGFRFLVRSGADGYIKESDSGKGKEPDAFLKTANKKYVNSILELTASLEDASISASGATIAAHGLSVQSGGSLVDQSRLFDLKTRSALKRNEDILEEQLPRLWARQIPNFIVAYHNKGQFDDIEVHHISDKVKEWENDHRKDLSRLAALVHRIVDLLREGPHRKIEIRYHGQDILEVREALPDAVDALSPEVKALWITEGSMKADEVLNEEDSNTLLEWKEKTSDDFTACSGSCGYCGLCGSSRV